MKDMASPDATVIITKKTAAPEGDMKSMMFEKIVKFLTDAWANPETVKSLIKEVAPKLEAEAKKAAEAPKTDTSTEEPSPWEVETPAEEKSKEDAVEEENLSLQDRLLKMCK